MSVSSKNATTAIAALGATVMLLLTGCTGSDEPKYQNGAPVDTQEGVFEFQTPRYGSDSSELVVRIPESLVAAAGSDIGELLVTEAKLTARELDSAKYCAVDLEPVYAGDGADALTAPTMTESEWKKSNEEAFLSDVGAESMAEVENAIEQGGDEAEYLKELYEGYFGGQYKPQIAWSWLSNAKPIADFDESAPARGLFYEPGYKRFTYVNDCAASPTEEGDFGFTFPMQDDNGKVSTLAELDFSVMKSGTITVTEAEVNGFIRDTDGNWIVD